MQATEIFYNVLWWSKNARQHLSTERMNLIMKAAAAPTSEYQRDIYHIAIAIKDLAQYWKSMPARVEAVLEAKVWYRTNILLLLRCGKLMSRWYPGVGAPLS